MTTKRFSVEEQAGHGFTHQIIVGATDVAAMTSGSASSVLSVTAGQRVVDVAWRVKTVFANSSPNNGTLVFKLGDGDGDAIYVASTTALKTAAFGSGVNASMAKTYNADDTVDIIVTAGTQAITTAASGELHLFLRVVDLAKF